MAPSIVRWHARAKGVEGVVPASFHARFGRPPDATASAPGRINLIGEHTDYNGGAVLPIATPQRTHVGLTPRAGRRVRVLTTADVKDGHDHAFELGAEAKRGSWTDYVEGVTATLAASGHTIDGFEAVI